MSLWRYTLRNLSAVLLAGTVVFGVLGYVELALVFLLCLCGKLYLGE